MLPSISIKNIIFQNHEKQKPLIYRGFFHLPFRLKI
uniref:Uncharacterized protein n=1 Tax=Staphylococcus phage HS06 TaxID=3056400 RepID=A0AA49X3K3_9VIRU|nr:MAG: hypothetical protein [Staphylococcus phage HS06]